MILALLALRLLTFTGPNGQEIEINPDQVVSVRPKTAESGEHFHGKVKCLIHTADGKFIAVQEDCATVNQRLGHDQGEKL